VVRTRGVRQGGGAPGTGAGFIPLGAARGILRGLEDCGKLAVRRTVHPEEKPALQDLKGSKGRGRRMSAAPVYCRVKVREPARLALGVARGVKHGGRGLDASQNRGGSAHQWTGRLVIGPRPDPRVVGRRRVPSSSQKKQNRSPQRLGGGGGGGGGEMVT